MLADNTLDIIFAENCNDFGTFHK